MVKVLFRTVLEVLGKPQKHVEQSLKEYVQKLKQNKRYHVVHEEYADLKKQDQEMWSTFAELEVKAESLQDLIHFCFEYMPALIEVLQPREFTLNDTEATEFFNNLQASLHQVDVLAKHLKVENDHLKRNMAALLKNYLVVLLAKKSMTAEELHRLTGVEQNKLEDYLDLLLDEGKVDLKNSVYSLIKESLIERK